jgi:hypothetical protein
MMMLLLLRAAGRAVQLRGDRKQAALKDQQKRGGRRLP